MSAPDPKRTSSEKRKDHGSHSVSRFSNGDFDWRRFGERPCSRAGFIRGRIAGERCGNPTLTTIYAVKFKPSAWLLLVIVIFGCRFLLLGRYSTYGIFPLVTRSGPHGQNAIAALFGERFCLSGTGQEPTLLSGQRCGRVGYGLDLYCLQ